MKHKPLTPVAIDLLRAAVAAGKHPELVGRLLAMLDESVHETAERCYQIAASEPAMPDRQSRICQKIHAEFGLDEVQK